jgi:hypothetical protein
MGMKNFVNSNGRLIIVIYLILTIIKFFTANIYTQIEENPTIYFKLHPTITNTFNGSDRAIEYYNEKYTWYEKGHYWVLFHSNGFEGTAFIYSVLIASWWVMSAGFIVYAVFVLLKK